MSAATRRFLMARPPLWNFVILLLLVGLIGVRWFRGPRNSTEFDFDSSRRYFVERVVDGDTLLLRCGTRVRLLGVNTPETKHPTKAVDPLGLKAAAFTRRYVEGQYVTLQFDRERRDKYRRVLAFVDRDGWLLNEELVRHGFSRAETRFPYSTTMKKRLKQAEEEAREHQRGLCAEKR
ncbi:MAG: thermonuclease family protein [Planctomycetes bacterium]|nr:thermonuclease family protein [Planctomycetota bacterium]